jgi:proline iminopeptidase
MIFRYAVILVSFLSFSYSCSSPGSLSPKTGFINVQGGKVWYEIVGEGNKTPILLLHGGPCVPSYYLDPLRVLSHNRPLIYIDQLGCGRSDRITDTLLMTPEVYREQLEEIRRALHLDTFYLYGQSWGTMLATEYYLQYPEAVKAIIYSSPCLSSPLWLQDADTLIGSLPDSVKQVIQTNEKNKTFSSQEYQKAVRFFYDRFLTRKQPRSADMENVDKSIGVNVYEYMWGPSEFTATGILKNYDRTGDLHNINVPTLFIAGQYDEARAGTVKYYASLVKHSQFVLIPGAGHLTMQDNPQADIRAISEFLDQLEGYK